MIAFGVHIIMSFLFQSCVWRYALRIESNVYENEDPG